MTFEEKREIWDAILECARHAPLKAPTQLAEELLTAHSRVWGDSTEEPPCSPRMPMTAKEVEDMTDYPFETSNKIYELGNDLGYLARLKAEKRALPTDASNAENALNELTKVVKTLYGLSGKGHRQPAGAGSPDSQKQRQPSA